MPIDTPIPPSLPPLDANGDRATTLADAGPWLLQVYFLPGDGVLWLVAAYLPSLAQFFGFGATPNYGGLWSGLISAFVWLALFVMGIIACGAVRDFDRRVTRWFSTGCRAALRRARIALAVLRSKPWRRERARASTVELAEDLVLTDEELRLLRAHFNLAPGYALHASDGAHQLKLRASQARALLEKLVSLGLLSRTLGGDGEEAYTLSAAGRGYLVFHQLAEPR
jgi:hypothetical protein